MKRRQVVPLAVLILIAGVGIKDMTDVLFFLGVTILLFIESSDEGSEER